MTVRTLDDARRFCRAVRPGVRLAMVGAGFIGLELAAFARQRGAEVVVLEAQERVLKRGVPAPIAAIIAARHSAEGVRIMANARIVEASLGPSQVAIRLGTGETLLADHVVVNGDLEQTIKEMLDIIEAARTDRGRAERGPG